MTDKISLKDSEVLDLEEIIEGDARRLRLVGRLEDSEVIEGDARRLLHHHGDQRSNC